MPAYERGRAAWPTLALSREAFEAHVATCTGSEAHAADLYLACACARGDAAAIALFEQQFVSQIPRYVARVDASAAVADEAKQFTRSYLLVGEAGGAPRIADYAGRGPLAAWVRVIASRFVLQMKRKDRRSHDSDGVAAARLAAAEPNPEVALLRARYGGELATALRAAVAGLSDKQRALLKLAVIDELGITELGELYGVHRATVARWISQIKQQTLAAAIAALRDRLGLDTDAVDSLCRAVRSQLEFSLGGMLGD